MTRDEPEPVSDSSFARITARRDDAASVPTHTTRPTRAGASQREGRGRIGVVLQVAVAVGPDGRRPRQPATGDGGESEASATGSGPAGALVSRCARRAVTAPPTQPRTLLLVPLPGLVARIVHVASFVQLSTLRRGNSGAPFMTLRFPG